ncbi:site-2 protease family protein [Candidatus Woesearchaeota archaeon]|nr:site-2 protease family protein [Candidatus Woesearchaeota archaeon]
MMDVQSIAAIVFVLLLALLLYLNRQQLQIQKIFFPLLYVVMYRTKIGIPSMDTISKRFPKTLKWLGYTGIVVGFIGMVAIAVSLLHNLYNLIFVPAAVSGVGIVQPFAKDIPGTFFVPFFYFIISIFVLVIVHEFSHGVLARLYGLDIKSSGLAFLGVIAPILPAAFVEPDEKKLVKRPVKEQLSIFAAGPFSNILVALLIVAVVFFAVNPLVSGIVEYQGVQVTGFAEKDGGKYPAEFAGMQKGELVTVIDNTPITTVENFTSLLGAKKPGDAITIVTNVSSYTVTLTNNPTDTEKPYMGIYVGQSTKIKESFEQKYGTWLAPVILWLAGLLLWMYVLNVGIGLFNLLPIPICDGGRMFQLVCQKLFEKERAQKVWKNVGIFFILLILVNLFLGFAK